MAKGSQLGSDIDFIKEFEELRLKQKILIESLNRKKHSNEGHLLTEMNSKLDFLVKLFKDSQDTGEEEEEFDQKEYLDTKFSEMIMRMQNVERSLAVMDDKVDKIETKIHVVHDLPDKDSREEIIPVNQEVQPLQEEKEIPTQAFEEQSRVIEDTTSVVADQTVQENASLKPPTPPVQDEEPILDPKTIAPEPKAQSPKPEVAQVPQKVVDEKKVSKDELPPPPGFTVDESKVEQLAQESDDKHKHKGWFGGKKKKIERV